MNESAAATTTTPSKSSPEIWDGDERAPESTPQAIARKNRKLLMILASVGVGMLIFAFANVPLFNMFCEAIGFSQQSGEAMGITGDAEEIGRDIDVYFYASAQGQIPISFRPLEAIQETRVGKVTVNDYEFINLSNRTVYFSSTHMVRPTAAGREKAFKLGQCFCYRAQKIEPRQKLTLPVQYKFTEEIPEGTTRLTMQYAIFELTKDDYERRIKEEEKEDFKMGGAGTLSENELEGLDQE